MHDFEPDPLASSASRAVNSSPSAREGVVALKIPTKNSLTAVSPAACCSATLRCALASVRALVAAMANTVLTIDAATSTVITATIPVANPL